MPEIDEHRAVQDIARKVLTQLKLTLSPSDTERKIANRAKQLLADEGITRTWYYDCPALVLAGARTSLSVSGKDYIPADDEIGETNLVTVDLSPSQNGVWGDCARSFYVEMGVADSHPQIPEFLRGKQALATLHARLMAYTKLDTSFDSLFHFASSLIQAMGFSNLDSYGNLGHTIEVDSKHRSYIDARNTKFIKEAQLFTFEPHILAPSTTWGFKHEEIYYLANGQLRVL